MTTETTDRLGLPYLMPAQAQKHVTVNETLRRLDALVQAGVLSRTISVQPATPQAGDAYLLPAGPSGTDWGGFAEHDLVVFQDGGWARFAPRAGYVVHVADDDRLVVHDGSVWRDWSDLLQTLQNLLRLGIGTTADAANPFAAKLNAALWTALGIAEGGTGDLRYTLNKEAAANVLSVLFQSGWSGRAELGLIGDDSLVVKVSPDGVSWRESVRIDPVTADLDLPSGFRRMGLSASVPVFTPGGDGEVSIWRADGLSMQNPRSAVLANVATDLLTLTAPEAGQFFHPYMQAVSMVRIWNLTRDPIESAWIVARPTASTLQVSDAAMIAGWQTGDSIQIGDPTSVTPGRCIALDISPMMQNRLGQVFRQTGIMVKSALGASVAGDSLTLPRVALEAPSLPSFRPGRMASQPARRPLSLRVANPPRSRTAISCFCASR